MRHPGNGRHAQASRGEHEDAAVAAAHALKLKRFAIHGLQARPWQAKFGRFLVGDNGEVVAGAEAALEVIQCIGVSSPVYWAMQWRAPDASRAWSINRFSGIENRVSKVRVLGSVVLKNANWSSVSTVRTAASIRAQSKFSMWG